MYELSEGAMTYGINIMHDLYIIILVTQYQKQSSRMTKLQDMFLLSIHHLCS